jgi:glutamyl-Q tRNA(Asp) synthetase
MKTLCYRLNYRSAITRRNEGEPLIDDQKTLPASGQSAFSPYVGRFAPSPTGPLHFGSLVAAAGSYLEARIHQGLWLLRMEDVDLPRCTKAAAESILHTLESFGFEWDGAVVWQSQRRDAYAAALDQLRKAGRVFPCACTRRELADSTLALAIDGSALYPGTCRTGLPQGRDARSWRVRVTDETFCFDDAVQGKVCSDLAHDVGDFVLLRADGLYAYQLAVIVDDATSGVTQVVRGADLLHSTARQIFLQRCLALPSPAYAHLPLAVNAEGEKLSKQTLAAPLDAENPVPVLFAALQFLGQNPPPHLLKGTLPELWQWAHSHWSLAHVAPCLCLPYNSTNTIEEK